MLSIDSVSIHRLSAITVKRFNVSDERTEVYLSDGTVLVRPGNDVENFPVGPVGNLDTYYREVLKKYNAAFFFGKSKSSRGRLKRCTEGYAKERKRPAEEVKFNLEW